MVFIITIKVSRSILAWCFTVCRGAAPRPTDRLSYGFRKVYVRCNGSSKCSTNALKRSSVCEHWISCPTSIAVFTAQRFNPSFWIRKAGVIGKPDCKRPLGRPRRRWQDNIKMDLQEVGMCCGDWMSLAQDTDSWRALVSTVMNFAGDFLISCNTS